MLGHVDHGDLAIVSDIDRPMMMEIFLARRGEPNLR